MHIAGLTALSNLCTLYIVIAVIKHKLQDLHRTGCSGFSGHDNDEERAMLKRVLLAYARWNKKVGYCQGFNIIAALILDVMDREEDCALKVCAYYWLS